MFMCSTAAIEVADGVGLSGRTPHIGWGLPTVRFEIGDLIAETSFTANDKAARKR
jgi:hypothetical protein